MLFVGICDDLQQDRTMLEELLNEYFSSRRLPFELSQFHNAEALLSSFAPDQFHLLFLDIYMPGISGVELARQIYAQDPSCCILFTTTSKDHAIDSYAVRAAGYLVKPYGMRELNEVLDWCLERMEKELQSIEIISQREKIRLPLKDIHYIEVRGRSSLVYTRDKNYTTNMRLGELEQALGSDFLRNHRSYIVNMLHIAKPLKEGFKLTNGTTVPISIDNLKSVKQQYFDWLFLNTWEGHRT